MIFVTVGTQLPFDRLVKTMDELTPSLGGEQVICQSLGGKYKPLHMDCSDYIDKREYSRLFSEARVIVAHAGTGSILNAMKHGKHIIIMPRKASLGEHRNDHQTDTASALQDYPNVHVALDETQLISILLNTDFSVIENPPDNNSVCTLCESIKTFLM
ncbi:MAG: glycosyl transferase family 28 [Muribaculum sp.]|nr:glycosyl transferase family 28 [Muribaculum sp.]